MYAKEVMRMRKGIALIAVICLVGTGVLAESPPSPTPLARYSLRASPDEVRVYATRSTKANIVGYLIPGGNQEVQVLSVTGDWCYISFTSVYGVSFGYVPLSCVDVAAAPTPTPRPAATYEPGTPGWIKNIQSGYRLNLREEPSGSAKSLGKYYTGTPVVLTGNAENGFVQVLLAGTVLGWVDVRFLTTDALDFVPETPIVTVKSSGGTLRSGPGTDGRRLGWFSKGQAVTVLGVRSDGWYHVQVDEQVGYMAESVLTGNFPFGYGMDSDNPAIHSNTDQTSVFYINTRSSGSLHLRKSASSTSSSLGQFYTGTALSIISYTRNGWAYVRIGQTEGYMDASYLTSTCPTQIGKAYIVRNSRASGLNLRGLPSTGGEILDFLPNSTEVTVLGTLSNGWCYVNSSGTLGYLLGSGLTEKK